MSGLRTPLAVRALFALATRMRADGDLDFAFLGPRPKGALKPGRILGIFVTDRAADDSDDPLPGQTDQYVDTTDITCNAISWSGGTDIGDHMDACAAVYDAFRQLIEADQTLGGVCEVAFMGRRRSWSPEQVAKGAVVFLAFTVRVQSYV